ncbi:unnamed protein product [Effrenium voratum]|nr:unnamed protein product [Effrenium voratum]
MCANKRGADCSALGVLRRVRSRRPEFSMCLGRPHDYANMVQCTTLPHPVCKQLSTVAFTGLHKDSLECEWRAFGHLFSAQHSTVSTTALVEHSAYSTHTQLLAQVQRHLM